MRRSPERLAWMVLLASFLSCCAISVGVPAAAWSFINTATVAPAVTVKLQAGRTVAFFPPATEADARVVSQEGRALEESSTIIVDNDNRSQAMVTIAAPDNITTTLVTLQLYSGARLRIERARLPRFGNLSRLPGQIVLYLQSGRIQVQKQDAPASNARVEVRTQYGVATLGIGSYSFEASPGEMAISARQGLAWIQAGSSPDTTPLVLQSGQRTAVTALGVQGILPPLQDLITNGNFQSGLSVGWKPIVEVGKAGDLSGTVSILGESPDTSLLLDRFGQEVGWGRTGASQEIGENVAGRRSLQLRVQFVILFQELQVCGGLGSECPMMVTVAYRDAEGQDREWTQGFYADGTPSAALPDEIVTAPTPRNKHVAARLGVRETFESGDLLSTLPNIQQIRSIRLYAEGHGLRTQVYSVELLLSD